MTNEELKQKVNEILPNSVTCYLVENVNYKPHMFMITEKHIANSKGMYLDTNSAPCGIKNCKLTYEEHTSDKVIMLQLKNDILRNDVQQILKLIVDTLPENSFDGFTFIRTDENYKIIEE